MSSTFDKRLAHARAVCGMTQRELADAVGITWSQISRYEAGKAHPRLAVLMKLAEVLGVEVGTLSGDQEDEHGREVTIMLTGEEEQKIEEFATASGITFNEAINKIMGMGLKMKVERDPDMLAQLEAEIPGAYEKLVKLLSKE